MSINIGTTGTARVVSKDKEFTVVEMVNPLNQETIYVKLRNH
jgi:hypothetical protein